MEQELCFCNFNDYTASFCHNYIHENLINASAFTRTCHFQFETSLAELGLVFIHFIILLICKLFRPDQLNLKSLINITMTSMSQAGIFYSIRDLNLNLFSFISICCVPIEIHTIKHEGTELYPVRVRSLIILIHVIYRSFLVTHLNRSAIYNDKLYFVLDIIAVATDFLYITALSAYAMKRCRADLESMMDYNQRHKTFKEGYRIFFSLDRKSEKYQVPYEISIRPAELRWDLEGGKRKVEFTNNSKLTCYIHMNTTYKSEITTVPQYFYISPNSRKRIKIYMKPGKFEDGIIKISYKLGKHKKTSEKDIEKLFKENVGLLKDGVTGIPYTFYGGQHQSQTVSRSTVVEIQ